MELETSVETQAGQSVHYCPTQLGYQIESYTK